MTNQNTITEILKYWIACTPVRRPFVYFLFNSQGLLRAHPTNAVSKVAIILPTWADILVLIRVPENLTPTPFKPKTLTALLKVPITLSFTGFPKCHSAIAATSEQSREWSEINA